MLHSSAVALPLLTVDQVFHPSGATFITAGARGEFREWDVISLEDDGMDSGEPVQVDKKQSRLLKKMHNDSQIGK